MNDTEEVKHNGKLFAIIIRASFQKDGIHFFTENHLSQQVAYMKHPKGKVIEPHIHNLVVREVLYTHEVLFIRSGRLKVDFYDDDKVYLDSRVLCAGDTILLSGGGHGFSVLDNVEMIEVKQGPYAGENDKTRFSGIDNLGDES